MRVGIIAPPWVPVPPPAYGGTEAVIDNLARGLRAAGHEVLLYATGDSGCPVHVEWTCPRAVGLTAGGSGAVELSHVVDGYEAMADWGADIVHDHTLTGPVYSWRTDRTVVTTNHGPFDREMARYFRAIAPSVPVVAISHDQAAAANGTPVAAVIHHGIDVDAVAPGRGDGGYALFLGRMHPHKGVDAAARIAAAAGMSLKIASKLREPHEHEYFRSAVEPLLGGDIEYLGEVAAAEKCELLRDAACLLNPIAWSEPFGMVMVEALAHGTPVVATPRGSVPELVDDGVTGLVRATEPELADALAHVPSLDRDSCRRAAAERFSTCRMVANHVALYHRLLGAESPGRAD